MSDADWPLYRPRAAVTRPSLIGRRASYRSAHGLESTVEVLVVDDTGTQVEVRTPFGRNWLPLSELRFPD